MRHRFKILILLFFFTIIRLIPIIRYEYCFGTDCPSYLNNIIGNTDFKEPFFTMVSKMFYNVFGMNELTIMKIFIVSLPVFFSIGLYILLRDIFKERTVIILITVSNLILSLNAFWAVMIRNGLMLVFLPFFLHYYLKEDYGKMFISMILMMVTHTSFFLFTIPIGIHLLYRKNLLLGLIVLLFSVGFFALYNVSYIETIGYIHDLPIQYFVMDIAFLFFGIMALRLKVEQSFKFIFFFIIIVTLLLMPTSEAWRSLFLLNIPALLLSGYFIESNKNKVIDNILKAYIIFLFISFIASNLILQSIKQEDISMYRFIGSLANEKNIIITTPSDRDWILYFSNQTVFYWDFVHNKTMPNKYDYILYDSDMPLDSDKFKIEKEWPKRVLLSNIQPS